MPGVSLGRSSPCSPSWSSSSEWELRLATSEVITASLATESNIAIEATEAGDVTEANPLSDATDASEAGEATKCDESSEATAASQIGNHFLVRSHFGFLYSVTP